MPAAKKKCHFSASLKIFSPLLRLGFEFQKFKATLCFGLLCSLLFMYPSSRHFHFLIHERHMHTLLHLVTYLLRVTFQYFQGRKSSQSTIQTAKMRFIHALFNPDCYSNTDFLKAFQGFTEEEFCYSSWPCLRRYVHCTGSTIRNCDKVNTWLDQIF